MKPLSDNKKAIIRVLLERIKQSQEDETDPRLDEMVNRSIEIGRNIENQAEEMDNTTQQTEQNAT